MESSDKVLVLTPEATIKIIQDGYHNSLLHKSYVVMMARMPGEDPMDDATYIAKSMIDIYNKLVVEFEIEKYIKKDIEKYKKVPRKITYLKDEVYVTETVIPGINASEYFYSMANEESPNEYRVAGHHIPYLFFATPEDVKNFVQIATVEVTKLISKYKA